jgi:general secretion pathway protein K
MTRRQGRSGAALLIVLWLLALSSALAVAVVTSARTESHLARNLAEEASARALAQAGVHRALVFLLAATPAPGSGADYQEIRELDLFGAKVRLAVRDECGKIDINTGWGPLVLGLVRQYEADEKAIGVAQAILDWRDPDRRRRPQGAEDADYAAAGRPYGARDGLFEAIDELQQVLGVSAPLYARLAPDITVDCLNAGVDPLAASPAVLASIPGMDPAKLAAYRQARREAAAAGASPPELEGGKEYVEESPAQAFSVRSAVELPSGARAEWEAVVWIAEDAPQPFRFRTWRQSGRDAAASE